MKGEARERDEYGTPVSPDGLRVVQVTSDPDRNSGGVYLDCPSWTPDSRRFLFEREASADGSRKAGLWMCDTEDGFRSWPVMEFDRAEGFHNPGFDGVAGLGGALSPDGSCAYQILRRGRTVEVLRVDLETGRTERQPVATAPAPLRVRGAVSVSADSERLLMGCWLGDGLREGAPWGAIIFNLRSGGSHTVEFGNGYRNMHAQYSHDPDPAFSHDLLLNAHLPKLADGSWLTPPDGSWRFKDLSEPADALGCAYTVVRDDGTNWRVAPLGRAPHFVNGGHNTWRGREYSVVSAVYNATPERWRSPLLEAAPVAARDEAELWLGQRHPQAHPVDLTRKVIRADSCHFGFDGTGRHCVSDTDGYNHGPNSFVWIGTYGEEAGGDPFLKTRYLLFPRTSWKGQPAHPHPSLSPDGRFVVFQSDYPGRPQVHVAHGFDYPS